MPPSPIASHDLEPTRLLGFDHIQHWMTWLRSLGSRDTERSYGNLVSISEMGVEDDLMESMILQMEREFLRLSDVDRALNNLQRFMAASRSTLSLATLFQRDESALPVLLQLFSTSQHCSDLLIRWPHDYDYLRLTGGHPRNREEMIVDLRSELAQLSDVAAIPRALARFKHRETLRIAYGDIVLGLSLETTTQQISHVADAVCQSAYESARRACEAKWGPPLDEQQQPVACSILALGKLGGSELNYSSDIDLVFVYETDRQSDSCHKSHQKFFDEVVRHFNRILGATGQPAIYRVDLRLRPDGSQGPLTQSLSRMIGYYENRGRTWERQAFLKARVIAGDNTLGATFLQRLEPWIHQKYLSHFQIESIRTLKRKIEQRSAHDGVDQHDIKTGHGGIRDVEFAIQFLQLLHAANQPSIRTGNTLKAIELLQRCDCLTLPEATHLQRNYRLLRQVEHRLQLMFDLQTHRLPEDPWELRKLALRCGFSGSPNESAFERFRTEIDRARETNHRILNHLLHQAFPAAGAESPEATSGEVDLILDPSPSSEMIKKTLTPYGFVDPDLAFRRLKELSRETSRFLSDQRCRHFFAAICRPLLQRVSNAPNPTETLTELSRVAESLGNKGVLWEWFSGNPPSLDLCVRLCSVAPYLTSILTGNPGMLDELMDSLLLDRLPNQQELQHRLEERLRGAEDTHPILHSFKDAMHLLIGVRDVLGKAPLQLKHRFLSDVAEACLTRTLDQQYSAMVQRWGQPCCEDGTPMPWIVIAQGKLGGREPNYHSDLDLAFVYLHDGQTKTKGRQDQPTSHQHFFSCLAAEVIKTLSGFGPQGRLYEVDCRLRPTGKSGALSVSLPRLASYFRDDRAGPTLVDSHAELWERQALCKARVLCPEELVRVQVEQQLMSFMDCHVPRRTVAESIYRMRERTESGASDWNLKRGAGGTMDIEFAVQMLQLIHPGHSSRSQNTLEAILELKQLGLLPGNDADWFSSSYEFLREVESRLRLLNLGNRHDLPDSERQWRQLAHLLKVPSADQLRATIKFLLGENRRRFNRLVSQYCDLPNG